MGNPALSSRLYNQTLQNQFTMAIISKRQLVLMCFIVSLFGGSSAVIFGVNSAPVWTWILIASFALFACICICLCYMKANDEEVIETRFRNQPVPSAPVLYTIPTQGPSLVGNAVPYTIIDMNNQTSSGDLPPSYQEATNPKYSHYG